MAKKSKKLKKLNTDLDNDTILPVDDIDTPVNDDAVVVSSVDEVDELPSGYTMGDIESEETSDEGAEFKKAAKEVTGNEDEEEWIIEDDSANDIDAGDDFLDSVDWDSDNPYSEDDYD